jgi:hypothetical protein
VLVTSFIHPDDRLKNLEIERLSKVNQSASLKTDTLQKKGAIVIIQWTTSIDLSGQLIYGIGRDIRDTRSTANLLNSERLLNDAQKIAKIGSWNSI